MATILIMEDDADQARLLGALLTSAGHEVEITFSGSEAWAMVLVRPFDVLLTDMRVLTPMGIKQSDGGLALIIRLRNATRDDAPEWIPAMKIVAISGSGTYSKGALDRAGTFGADICLHKPVNSADLIEAIRSVLEGP